MGVIDVSAGFPEACKKKAEQKLQPLFDELRDLPEEDQFMCLKDRFDCFARATQACLDNFDTEQFYERGNHEKSDLALNAMMLGGIQGVLLTEALKAKMEELSLSRINGTSFVFAQCSGDCVQIREKALRGIHVFNDEMHRRSGGVSPAV